MTSVFSVVDLIITRLQAVDDSSSGTRAVSIDEEEAVAPATVMHYRKRTCPY
jgi:hypothetical protein